MKTAIYARQSVEKNNSLSILGQIEACRRFLDSDEEYLVYKDEGYSGKDTKRPAFNQMQEDIINGLISKVIIYRFDRISRSLIDFIKIQQLYDKHNITLVSCSEQFDTSTEMGKMMLKILIMFAEMERNAIVARISDNYAVRAEKMMYLGGKTPFGYEIRSDYSDLRYFVENKSESDIIKQIFDLYAVEKLNCEEIANHLNKLNITSKNGCLWRGSAILKILKNPFYTMTGKYVENYFSEHFDKLKISENKYNGYIKVKNIIYSSLHSGLIEEKIWLDAQKIIAKRSHSKNIGEGKSSFLQGKMVCLHCGKTIYIKSNGKGRRYLECQGKRLKICTGVGDLRVEDVENACFETILEQIQLIKPVEGLDLAETDEIVEKIREIDEKIAYYRKNAKDDVMFCFELEECIRERSEIVGEVREDCEFNADEICGKLKRLWKSDLILEKKRVVDVLVERVQVGSDGLSFYMK